MQIGMIPVNIGVSTVEEVVGLARLAEDSGFESVWTFEHVVVPLEYESKYPYDASGKMGASPETPFVDPLIALTAVAAATKTIRLGTGVNILPQANPLFLAKQAASLDALSGGRLLLGLGIGWLREEFDAMGVPFERRGARFDDYVEAMRKVWSGDVVEHDSDFVQWSGFKSYPRPVQDPLPVIIGGSKGKVLERIARRGNGWYVPGTDIGEIAALLAPLKDACADVGRDYSEIEITCMWPGRGGPDAVRQFEDLGVHRLVVPLFALGGDPASALPRFGEEVIAQVA